MAVHHIPQTGTFAPTGHRTATRPNRWIAPVVGATFAAAAVAGIIGLSIGSSDTTTATVSNAEYNGLKTALAESMVPAQSAAASAASYQLVEDTFSAALAVRSATATDGSHQLVENARAAALVTQSAAATVSSFTMVEDAISSALAERSATTSEGSNQFGPR